MKESSSRDEGSIFHSHVCISSGAVTVGEASAAAFLRSPQSPRGSSNCEERSRWRSSVSTARRSLQGLHQVGGKEAPEPLLSAGLLFPLHWLSPSPSGRTH
uniref:Uncharacterized protein n=1 Tax=Knipowitschia caucasica TaxID=637954 RepID=A0AAV2L5I7_KNICA